MGWGAAAFYKMKSKYRLLRNFVLAFIALAFFIAGAFMLINRPATIRHVLNAATVKSPWKIKFEDFSWKVFENRIVVGGLYLRHTKTQKEAWIKQISAHYKPLALLRGKFVIASLQIDDVKLALPEAMQIQREKPSHIDITKLFFLQNVAIRGAIVRGVDVSLPKEIKLDADEIRFSIEPTFLGDTRLALRVDGLALTHGEESIANASSISVESSTALPKWNRDFPYINALEGKLALEDGRVEALGVERLDAKLGYADHKLTLDPLTVTIKGRNLTGALRADTVDQTFEAKIDIPRPISLPYLGRPLETVDTAGELSGSMTINGKGLLPSQSGGKAEAAFTHRFSISPAIPIEVRAKAAWQRGIVTITDGQVIAQNDSVKFDGTVDAVKKKIALKAAATNFPVELIFDKFRNPHIRPIFGRTDCSGTFEGWGKQFHAIVKGTTHGGGYTPIVAETIETELDATYDKMTFHWNILQDKRQTGTADLDIKYGKKIPGQDRAKDIDLRARLDRHPLATTLEFAGVSGFGSGELTIKGPHLNFTGKGHAEIVDGKWFFVPFDRIETTMDLSRKKMVFRDIKIALQGVNPIAFAEPITMDILDGGIKLWGTPDPHFTLDIGYQYASRNWQIRKISYVDPEAHNSHFDVAGNVASGGGIHLKADGSVDIEILNPLGFLVREASGPMDFKLAADGAAARPSINGKMEFKKCLLSLRQIHLPMDQLEGALIFEGNTIRADHLTALVDEGSFTLNGDVGHSGFSLTSTDLVFAGKNMRYRTDDGFFRMEFNGDATLKGRFPEPLLSGDITILDGKYTKDFNILESLTKPSAESKKRQGAEISFSPRLNLRVRNTGDLFIRNNVGDIGLRADLQIKGTTRSLQTGGTVEVTEGKLHYMGIEFDIMRGFLEFRESSTNPYLEVVAQKEINVYNVTIAAHGNVDNLAVDLSATSPGGPLEKRDVISLIAFGMTEMERQQVAAQAGQQFGVTMAAQQLTHVVERPITQFAHLDTFRLEAADPASQAISRVSIGKQLSDRLSIDFATDINTKDATQTVTAEYLITDNLLIKGSQSSNGRYEMDGAIRFRLR